MAAKQLNGLSNLFGMRVAIENRYFVLDGGLDVSMEREITPLRWVLV